jgi:CheY-like chemotaxis protein
MPLVSLFSASHCRAEEVAAGVAAQLRYKTQGLDELLAETSKRYQVPVDKLSRAMVRQRSVFDRWTHEKGRNVARIRLTLAELLGDDTVLHHFGALLIPKGLSNCLRVCLVAREAHRARIAEQALGLSQRAALKAIRKDDEVAKEWSTYLHDLGPWDRQLHDLVLPMDATPVDGAVEEICNLVASPAVQTPAPNEQSLADYRLAAQVALALAEQGHFERVECADGVATLTIDTYMLRLDAHRQQLDAIASKVPGVNMVKTKVGPNFSAPIGMPKLDLPSKVLLVDDEKEFVHTLSERLTTRNLESAIAYDGEQALAMVEKDAPEVMVLDLKMPGIDGLEVLRRVKRQSPATEVIILTGHGSEAEESLAEELGAFAYLHKPVDIDLLAKTMREAYQRVAAHRASHPDDSQGD